MYTTVMLIAGAALMILGADWLIRGASEIGVRLRIPKSVVGLTMVALGTSAPELFVNLMAAWDGRTGLALSNVSGSNLVNLCIGFGVCGLLTTLKIESAQFLTDLVMLVIAPVLVFSLFLISGTRLPFWSVLPLTALLGWYLVSLFRRTDSLTDEEDDDSTFSAMSVVQFVVGVAGLYGGGKLVLVAATNVAISWGVTEDVVALTVVAAVTSIPDVTASVVGAYRGEQAIAVGNLLGSNLSNIVLVLNGTLIVSGGGLAGSLPITIDYGILAMFSLLFVVAVGRRERLSRPLGAALLIAYVVYLAYRLQLR